MYPFTIACASRLLISRTVSSREGRVAHPVHPRRLTNQRNSAYRVVNHRCCACAGGSDDVPLRGHDDGERDRDGGIPQEDESAYGWG